MKKYRFVLLLAAALIFSACGQKAFMNIEEIPLPVEAKTGSIEGRYEVELDGAVNSILTELKKNYPKTQEKILFLPGETEAAKIFEFYAPKMTEKGLVKDANVPLQSRNFQQNLWKSDAQAVSVAVVDAGKDADGKAIKFLVIQLGDK